MCSFSTLCGLYYTILGAEGDTRKDLAQGETGIVKDTVLALKGLEKSHCKKVTGECGLRYGRCQEQWTLNQQIAGEGGRIDRTQ